MFRRQSAIKGQLSGCIEELVGNQKVVKAFSYEERAQQQFDRIDHQLYDVGVKAQFYSSLTNPCTRFVNGVVYAAVAIVGALSCIAGGFSVGALSSFLTYANQYTKPFNEISGVITELQNAHCLRRPGVRPDRGTRPDSGKSRMRLVLSGCHRVNVTLY